MKSIRRTVQIVVFLVTFLAILFAAALVTMTNPVL